MRTLADLYELVRRQTQTNVAELPDATINPWLKQGFERTIAARNDWPFYEESWDLTLPAGQYTLTLPANAHPPGIMSLRDDAGFRLTQINQEDAEDAYQFFQPVSRVCEYSVWGNKLTLWPNSTTTVDRTFRLRGFRQPVSWSTLTPASPPDCDERLHDPLAHYATALAYAQQEDELLEDRYMMRWQRDVELALKAIIDPAHHRPLVMGPHYRRSTPRAPFVINTGGF